MCKVRIPFVLSDERYFVIYEKKIEPDDQVKQIHVVN